MYRLLLFPLSRCVPLSPCPRCRWCRRHSFINLKIWSTLYCTTGLSWKQLRLTGAGIAHLTSSSSPFKPLHITNESKSPQIHSFMIIFDNWLSFIIHSFMITLIFDCLLLFQPTSMRNNFLLLFFVNVRRVLFFIIVLREPAMNKRLYPYPYPT